MELKNSKTHQNLMTAFLRESGAYNEYTFYGEQATADGYKQISNVFNQFATNEQAHAKVWFNLFHGISSTMDNLIDSADLENYERTVMYKEFSKTAKEEGFNDIAELFDKVAEIENQHEKQYRTLFENVKNKEVFIKKDDTTWQCLNCGHIHKGATPPETCPVCSYPKAWAQVKPKQN